MSQASVRPLSAAERQEVVAAKEWHPGCPVSLSQVGLLTVRYLGFDGRAHTGELVVNDSQAGRLQQVFAHLYAIRFPIRHMAFSDTYGPSRRPTARRRRHRVVRVPPGGGLTLQRHGEHGTGSWSEHAYGEAIDLNPAENPYVGCGMTRDRTSLSYLDRSRVRRGMVTPQVLAIFQQIGWLRTARGPVDQTTCTSPRPGTEPSGPMSSRHQTGRYNETSR